MSMRTDWQAAKEKAKRVNSGKDVPFKDLKLGQALDKVEAAAKEKDKFSIDQGVVWAKATDAWIAAGKAANTIVVTYHQSLPHLVMNDQARKDMDTYLSMHLMHDLNAIAAEGKRLEPKLKEKRKK